MSKPPHQPIELSDKEMGMVQQYANSLGISADEAATQLASESLARRYQSQRIDSAKVINIKRTK